jgi:hypothetical protein
MKSQRNHHCRAAVLFIISTYAFLATVAFGNADGPPDGYTNAPGETWCYSCHQNLSGSSSLSISMIPSTDSLVPGQTYTIRVALSSTGKSRWGFELTAIDDSLNGAGTFSLSDPVSTRLSDNPVPARDYVMQTAAGTYDGTLDGPVTWEFLWIAPEAGLRAVYFRAASVAGNGDNTEAGDLVNSTAISTRCCNRAGDASNDNRADIGDAVFLINRVFKAGPAPFCPDEGDPNHDCRINVGDAVYMIVRVFKSGPAPMCGCAP